jgi:hypothetical protein
MINNITSGFIDLDVEEIIALSDRFDSTPLMQTCHNVACSNLLGGGMLFEIEGKEIDPEEQRFFNVTWRRFVEELLRSHWMWGFAAVVIEPTADGRGGIPTVLDLCNFRILYRAPVAGASDYIFLVSGKQELDRLSYTGKGRSARGAMSWLVSDYRQALEERPIHSVLVFESTPPKRDGSIRSKVKALIPELDNFNSMRKSIVEQMDFMRYPILLTEAQPEAKISQEENVYIASAAAVPGQEPTAVNISAKERAADVKVRAQTLLLNHGFDAELLNGPENTRSEPLERCEMIHIPKGRKFAGQVDRHETDVLTKLEISLQETVGITLGVPRAMWAQSNNRLTSSNEDNKQTFQHFQLHTKHFIMPQLHVTFLKLYGGPFTRSMVENEAYSIHDVLKVLRRGYPKVEISLLGVPPWDRIEAFYMQGVLKYKSYIHLAAQHHDLPVSWFEEEPQLDLRTLIGAEPTETTVTTKESGKQSLSGTTSQTTTSQTTSHSNTPKSTASSSSSKGRPKKKQRTT